ncbi:hypothetical protein SARC_09752, partial [Sphaeroforma arctica JP610]
WDARLVEADWKPMAYRRFTMSALYYAQMNMGPRVQREVFVESKNLTLRAEISLSQDVDQEGEPIDIRLAIHKNGAVVRSVTAHVAQHVLFDCGTIPNYNGSHKAEKFDEEKPLDEDRHGARFYMRSQV